MVLLLSIGVLNGKPSLSVLSSSVVVGQGPLFADMTNKPPNITTYPSKQPWQLLTTIHDHSPSNRAISHMHPDLPSRWEAASLTLAIRARRGSIT